MNHNSEYEEAEIVDGSTRERDGDHFRKTAVEFGTETAQELRSQLLWAGFGTLFLFFLVAFVIISLIIALVIWLLPVFFAVLVIAIVIGAASFAGRVLYTLFK